MPQGTPRWDAEAQRWQRSEESAAYAPPPPPLPEYLPGVARTTAVPPPDGKPGTPGADALPDGARTSGRRRTAVVLLSVGAVLGAVGAAVWLGLDGDERQPSAGPGGPSSAAGPASGASGTPEPSDQEEASPGGVPSQSADGGTTEPEHPLGFRVAEDEEGFVIAVPEEWERTSGPNGVFYTAADERSLLQVFRITEADLTPLDAVRSASEALSQGTEDYREISLGPVLSGPENPAGDAAELHYAYDSAEAGGVRECIERAFTATNGDKYAVLACAPAEESPFQREVLTTALEHFAPDPS